MNKIFENIKSSRVKISLVSPKLSVNWILLRHSLMIDCAKRNLENDICSNSQTNNLKTTHLVSKSIYRFFFFWFKEPLVVCGIKILQCICTLDYKRLG